MNLLRVVLASLALLSLILPLSAQTDTVVVPQKMPDEEVIFSTPKETPPDSTITEVQPEIRMQDSVRATEKPFVFPGWTVNRLTAADLRRFPFRGIQNYLATVPGVVEVNGNQHFRGSRAGETGYLVDGIPVLNPFFNSNGVPLIPEAIGEIQVHTGAYGPALGSNNGGIVLTKMKTGGDVLRSSLDIQTDDFANPGSTFLKTSAFGYRNIVGTVGGPLPDPLPDIRFFLAGQHYFMRDRQPMFLQPFRFENLVTDTYGSRPPGQPLPGPVNFERNYLFNNWLESTTLQGNASISVAGIDLKVLGSYSHEENPDGGQWPVALQNYYRQKRNMLNKVTTKFGALQASYAMDDETAFRISLSFQDRFQRTYDPDFKHNWTSYSDSLANAKLGYPGFVSRYQGPFDYSTIFNFRFLDPSTPNNSYSKNRQNSFIVSAEASARLASFWKVEVGGKLESWTIRSFQVGNIRALNEYMDTNRDGFWDKTFTSSAEKRVLMLRQGGIDTYGYDMFGTDVDDGFDAPREPSFQSIYATNIVEDENVRLVLGGRYEVFRSGNLVPPDYIDPFPFFLPNLAVVDEKSLTPEGPISHFLPRVRAEYRVDDLTLYASYGRFAQFTALNNIYMSAVNMSQFLNPLSRVPYNLGGRSATFLSKPERSTLYEVGLRKPFAQGSTVSLRLYEKAMKGQLQLSRIVDQNGTALFVGLLNDGEGSSRGAELTMNLVHGELFYSLLSYSYSQARSRFADPKSDWRYVSDQAFPPFPENPPPLRYDQTHRGSILAGLRFNDAHGPVLNDLGVDVLFSFNSGQRYTRLSGAIGFGGATAWNIGVRPLVDPRSGMALEEDNSSASPWYFNFDLHLTKRFSFDVVSATVYMNILNLFDRKHILNVFPTTGSPNDDNWLLQTFADPYKQIPLYEEFYRTINLQNRWAYMGATGYDMYGTPRQIRFGVMVEM